MDLREGRVLLAAGATTNVRDLPRPGYPCGSHTWARPCGRASSTHLPPDPPVPECSFCLKFRQDSGTMPREALLSGQRDFGPGVLIPTPGLRTRSAMPAPGLRTRSAGWLWPDYEPGVLMPSCSGSLARGGRSLSPALGLTPLARERSRVAAINGDDTASCRLRLTQPDERAGDVAG